MIMDSSWKYSLACALLLVATTYLICGCSSASVGDVVDLDEHHLMVARFHLWMTTHKRSYATDEEKKLRFQIYADNMRYIEEVNSKAAATGLTYELGEGPFTDLTNDEFMAMYTAPAQEPDKEEVDDGFITTHAGPVDDGAPLIPPAGAMYLNLSVGAPYCVDWRAWGVVTPVKNQGQCGSCWAFGTVATVESLQAIKKWNLISLSEQELVDCDKFDNGCKGGWGYRALQWIILNGGITTESNYPYKAVQGVCQKNKLHNNTVKITGYRIVARNSEHSLMNAVANQPVAITIEAGGPNFQHYKRGVYNGPCGTKLNHVVTAVGYGRESDGTKYWIVKNSWGANWGDHGYIKMKKDITQSHGLCGLAISASYPLM